MRVNLICQNGDIYSVLVGRSWRINPPLQKDAFFWYHVCLHYVGLYWWQQHVIYVLYITHPPNSLVSILRLLLYHIASSTISSSARRINQHHGFCFHVLRCRMARFQLRSSSRVLKNLAKAILTTRSHKLSNSSSIVRSERLMSMVSCWSQFNWKVSQRDRNWTNWNLVSVPFLSFPPYLKLSTRKLVRLSCLATNNLLPKIEKSLKV